MYINNKYVPVIQQLNKENDLDNVKNKVMEKFSQL